MVNATSFFHDDHTSLTSLWQVRYVKRKAARDVDKALIRSLSVLVQTLSEELDRWRNWWHGAHSFLSPGDNSCPSETWEDKSEANIYETMQTPLSRMAVLFSPETPEKKRETPAAGRGVAPISPYVVLPAEVKIQTKLLMLLFWHDAKISLIASRH